jgi:hypothetical protein
VGVETSLMTQACEHKRGEYTDDYQRCLDCGREVALVGGVWFEVLGWIRVSDKIIQEAEEADA